MEKNQMNIQIRRSGKGVGFFLFVSVFCILTVLPAALFAGSVIVWGGNGYGKLPPPDGNNFIAIATEQEYSLALKSDGSIVAWGNNTWGQLNVPAGKNFIAIAAGDNHSLALKSDGSIVAWGDNTWDECNVPLPNTGFTAIAAGGSHSLALKSDGSIVAWGDKGIGQVIPPDVPPAGNN